MLRVTRSLALVLAASTLVACTDDPTDPAPRGGARAIHAIGNGPAMDFLLENVKVTPAAGLDYHFGTTYVEVLPGTRTLGLRPVGTTAAFLSTSRAIVAGTGYTIVAIGRMGAPVDFAPRLVTLVDDATPAATEAAIRFVHGSPATGNVDVYVTAPGDDIAAATPVRANVAFGGVPAPIIVANGTRRIRVTNAGTKTVVMDRNNIPLAARQRVTAVAVGDDAPGTGATSAFEVLLFPEN